MGCLFFKVFKGRGKRVMSDPPRGPSPQQQQQQQHSSGDGDSKSSSRANWTRLVNETSETIVIREKNRAVWGREFYRIDANSSTEVLSSSECGTFVWMGVLWGEGPPTGITIGFDELASCRTIVFTRGRGERLSMSKVDR